MPVIAVKEIKRIVLLQPVNEARLRYQISIISGVTMTGPDDLGGFQRRGHVILFFSATDIPVHRQDTAVIW
jgi:hypothetical protein